MHPMHSVDIERGGPEKNLAECSGEVLLDFGQNAA